MIDSELAVPSPLARFRLDGRTAVITGGGGHIGSALAHALGDAGAAVAVAGRDPDKLERVKSELIAKGVDAMAITVDVTDERSVAAMVDAVVARWGTLTIGINNAGTTGLGPAMDFEFAEWRRIMSVNLDGVFLCAKAEARVMRERGYGKIINTASQAGSIVTKLSEAAYCASKAGVIHLTRSLATEWAPHGIRVNSLSPGFSGDEADIESDAGREWLASLAQLTPLAGLVPLADLQGAAIYLASGASDSTTGLDLIIDRGYSLW